MAALTLGCLSIINACSSSETPAAVDSGGAGANSGGSLVTASGSAGVAGTPSVAGATGGGAGATAGGTAGAGGAVGATAGGGAAGVAGSGGSQPTAGMAGGPASCDGKAVFLDANTGDGNDAAKARVEVDFGVSADLPTGNESRTIEFWAYVLPSSWAGDKNTLFFYGTNNRKADGFGLDFGGVQGTIDPFTNAIFDNDDQPTGLNPCQEQWAHFAMTWDGTAVRAFVDGVEKAKKTSSEAQKTLMTGKTPLIIGSYPSNYFNGYIDEFRVWNVARSAEDITKTMKKVLVGNETGLTAYWKFDEDTGTNAADSVTTAGHTAHPGTLMASNPEQLPKHVPGVPLACP